MKPKKNSSFVPPYTSNKKVAASAVKNDDFQPSCSKIVKKKVASVSKDYSEPSASFSKDTPSCSKDTPSCSKDTPSCSKDTASCSKETPPIEKKECPKLNDRQAIRLVQFTKRTMEFMEEKELPLSEVKFTEDIVKPWMVETGEKLKSPKDTAYRFKQKLESLVDEVNNLGKRSIIMR